MKQAMTDLAVRTIYLGGMDPAKFPPVLSAFGPVPDGGQHELAECLVGKVGVYRLEYQMERPRPAVERERLQDIANAAKRLLMLLEIEDREASMVDPNTFQPRSWAVSWLFTELYAVAKERWPTTGTLDANERWRTLLWLLSDLKEAAVRCSPRPSQLVPGSREGKGGKRRHGPDPKGRLLHGLFETYAALRGRYPDNGRPVACDMRLTSFVRTALALAATSAPPFIAPDGAQYQIHDKACGPDLSKDTQTTDGAIRQAFDRWLRQTKARKADDLDVATARSPQ